MDGLLQYLSAHRGYSFNSITGHQLNIDLKDYVSCLTDLKNHSSCLFEQCIDLTVVDFLTYGQTEWNTISATEQGFSRAVLEQNFDNSHPSSRFSLVVHLLSVTLNQRLRVKCQIPDDLLMPSIVSIWPSASWYEREAFDLFGIVFSDHPDLRRILTDYGFVGHPFRKDFPTGGYVELYYDHHALSCVYEESSLEPRVAVPKVVRGAHS